MGIDGDRMIMIGWVGWGKVTIMGRRWGEKVVPMQLFIGNPDSPGEAV